MDNLIYIVIICPHYVVFTFEKLFFDNYLNNIIFKQF